MGLPLPLLLLESLDVVDWLVFFPHFPILLRPSVFIYSLHVGN